MAKRGGRAIRRQHLRRSTERLYAKPLEPPEWPLLGQRQSIGGECMIRAVVPDDPHRTGTRSPDLQRPQQCKPRQARGVVRSQVQLEFHWAQSAVSAASPSRRSRGVRNRTSCPPPAPSCRHGLATANSASAPVGKPASNRFVASLTELLPANDTPNSCMPGLWPITMTLRTVSPTSRTTPN